MALEEIKKAILDEADKKAEEILELGQKELEKTNSQWQEKIDQRKKEIIVLAQRKIDKKIQQTQFNLHSQNQSDILGNKQKTIAKVYDLAIEKLKALSDSQYIDLMTKLIDSLPDIEGEIISSQGKEELLKKSLGKTKTKSKLSKETVKSAGGFKFESKQINIDNTFEAIIKNLREKTLLPVTKILFTDNEIAE